MRHNRQDREDLIFLDDLPFSGAFYSRGLAEEVDGLEALALRVQRSPVFVAMDKNDLDDLPESLRHQLRFVSRRGDYWLYQPAN